MAIAPKAYADGQILTSNGGQSVTNTQQSGRQLFRVRNSAPNLRQSPIPRIGHNIWWFPTRLHPAKCMRTKADIESVSDSDALRSLIVSILNTASTAGTRPSWNPGLQKLEPNTTFKRCAK